MNLAFTFKLSLYALTGFVGLALAVAERGPIPFFSLPITIFAWWWCETGTRRSLNDTAALVLGIAALVAAGIEFFGESVEGRLLAGIHLVVYLTWISLLQQKSVLRCWLLLGLGIMHVAVGSVLTNATWYGLSMIAYVFGAIWTLSAFSVYRAALDVGAVDLRRRARAEAPSQVISTVRFEDDANWISMRLAVGVFLTTIGGLFISALFFTLIPRVWVGTALGIPDEALPGALRRSATGLATEVRLGDLRPILESNDPALTLRVFDNQTNEPIDPITYAGWLGWNEPLFRITVLTEYLGGRWRPDRAWSAVIQPLPPLPTDRAVNPVVPTVRQEIHLERLGTEVLPCLGRPIAMRDPEGYRCGRLQPLNILAERRDWFSRLPAAVDYMAYTKLPTAADRADPGFVATQNESVMFRLSNYKERCTDFPAGLDRLRNLTRQLTDERRRQTGTDLTDLQMARLFESHLRDSGQYTYSLESQSTNPLADPVEDFLFNHRAGHCQYFASALVLMYRAQGIPARMIVGFKGGEPQSDGSWMVEKRFAHAWVEAWIDNRKWVTFDATPEDGRAESVTEIGTKRNLWTTMASRLTGIWESNVLNISYERQDDVIYQPLRERLQAITQTVRDFVKSPRSSMTAMLLYLADPRNWLSVPGALGLATLAGLLWLVRRKTGWLSGWWGRTRSKTDTDQHPRIEFYERFVTLMQAQGRSRETAQTQAEFVHKAAGDLAPRLADPSLCLRLDALGDLYYRVRFGQGVLSESEQSRLDELLNRLEQELGPAASTAVRNHRIQHPVGKGG